MKILYIVPYVPNLIRVRPYNLIRSLTRRGHQVTVLTLWSEANELQDVEELRKFSCQVQAHRLSRMRSMANSLGALPSRVPLQAVYCWQSSLADIAQRTLAATRGSPDFDVIHIEHLRGARYGLYLKSVMSTWNQPVPIIWDSVDCISMLFRQASMHSKSMFGRVLTRFELGRTERYESWLTRSFDHTLVTSRLDREAFISLSRSTDAPVPITVVPNGVDLDHFTPDDGIQRSSAELVVSGKMSYHANITMVLFLVNHIMPLIWEKRPEVRLTVVGKDPPAEIRALASNPSITITGTVPDIRPYLRRATVAVVPVTYGAGIQNKVLEAMACGAPVVSTRQAVSALEVNPNQDVLLDDDPVGFAEQVLHLLEDPELRRRLGQAGRRYVENFHRWDSIAGQLEGIYLAQMGSKHLNRNYSQHV